MKKKPAPKPHAHSYAQHPAWSTHVYCTACGFAIVKNPRIWPLKGARMTGADEQQQPGEQHVQRLTRAQTAAALARVHECREGWTYWTKDNSAPAYGARREAEEASIAEWRANL